MKQPREQNHLQRSLIRRADAVIYLTREAATQQSICKPMCLFYMYNLVSLQSYAITCPDVAQKGESIARIHGVISRILQLQRCCSSHTEPAYSLGRSHSPAHGLWLAAIQLCLALFRRLMAFTPVIYAITWITTHLPTPVGWKAELTRLADQ